MPKIIVCQGLPASGKTTWAKEEVLKSEGKIKRINKDDLREMLDAGKWSKSNEQIVLIARDLMAEQFIKLNYDVIIDDTNLSPQHIKDMTEMAEELGAELEIKSFLDVPVAECLKRDAYRGDKKVGYKVIMEMYNRYIKNDVEKMEEIEGLPSAIICDLDGTLALLNGRNPYDASTCENDKLNDPVAHILHCVHQTGLGAKIIFVSGRENKYREQTLKFLDKHGFSKIIHEGLFMRETGDNRDDRIVKKEIFDANIKGKYNIKFVLDDRNKVVEMWRSIGLTCFQVAEGNF